MEAHVVGNAIAAALVLLGLFAARAVQRNRLWSDALREVFRRRRLSVLLVAGVFLPTFTQAVLNPIFLLAVAVVALLWLASFSLKTVPKWRGIHLGWRRREQITSQVSGTEKGGESDVQ